MDKKTPIYQCHIEGKGKMVSFAGYLLPIQYEQGVICEHMAVRTGAGMFDVSHMGEVIIKGREALSNIQNLFSNDFTSMKDNDVRYSPMLNYEGGIVDDLIVYKIKEDEYFIVINAANREKDVEWIKQNLVGDVIFEDVSDNLAQIALQGSKSTDILKKIVNDEDIPKKYYTFKKDVYVKDIKCMVSKTGYTGETGFEIYCDNENAAKLWELILAAGKSDGLIPCGLGARDTLRLEAAMPLYGHEMSDRITPLETELSYFVKLDKQDFIGKEALMKKGEPTVKRVGLKIIGRGIVRENCEVFIGEKEIGFVTSGTHCPFLGYPVAMAIIEKGYSGIGTVLEVLVRGRKIVVEVVALPFYKKTK